MSRQGNGNGVQINTVDNYPFAASLGQHERYQTTTTAQIEHPPGWWKGCPCAEQNAICAYRMYTLCLLNGKFSETEYWSCHFHR